MSPNPNCFLTHLQDRGYHPRSDKHSNTLAECIVEDLVRYCPRVRDRAQSGELVYDINFTLRAGTADWNVDLVFGRPALGTVPPPQGTAILRAPPASVEIAIELKAVMTEHRKAVKNRKRDFEAHHEHVHNYHAQTIAGGVLVVNAADNFRSPLRPAATTHRNAVQLVEHCISQFRAVAARGGPTGYGLDARCALVVNYSNVPGSSATYLTTSPAPSLGDPLHYDAFIQTLCREYTARF